MHNSDEPIAYEDVTLLIDGDGASRSPVSACL